MSAPASSEGSKVIRVVVAAGLLLCLTPVVRLAHAQVYQWTDKSGTVHYTDRPEDLPEPFRSKALKEIEREKALDKKAGTSPSPGSPSSTRFSAGGAKDMTSPDYPNDRIPPQSGSVDSSSDGAASGTEPAGTEPTGDGGSSARLDPKSKAFWQKKVADTRKKIADLEVQVQKLTEVRDRTNIRSLIFVTPKDRAEALKAKEDLAKRQADLDAAKLYLEEGIFEDARQAGVPPGWAK